MKTFYFLKKELRSHSDILALPFLHQTPKKNAHCHSSQVLFAANIAKG